MTNIQRVVINISAPPALAKEIQKAAKEENKTISELLREAFRVYKLRKEWDKFRMLGEKTAFETGIESYDDVERIAG